MAHITGLTWNSTGRAHATGMMALCGILCAVACGPAAPGAIHPEANAADTGKATFMPLTRAANPSFRPVLEVTDGAGVPPPTAADLQQVTLIGRFTESPGGPQFAWSQSTIGARFTGSTLRVTLGETPGNFNGPGHNFYSVDIDGGKTYLVEADITRPVSTYTLATDLSPGAHTVWVTKMTEVAAGVGRFLGFQLAEDGDFLPPPPTRERRLIFIGDSGLTGYGARETVDWRTMCRGNSTNEDAMAGLAAFVAERLDADLHTLAISGRGITQNLSGATDTTLPRVTPSILGNLNGALWDPRRFVADAVVIHAGGNDLMGPSNDANIAYFGTGPDDVAATQAFVDAYANFLTTLRAQQPNAAIICVLGIQAKAVQRQVLGDALRAAVAARNSAGDANVFMYDFLAPEEALGFTSFDEAVTRNNLMYGCDYHLSRAGAAYLAKPLGDFIAKRLGW